MFVVDEETMDPSEGQFLCWPLFDLQGVFEVFFKGEYFVTQCRAAGDDDPDILMYVPQDLLHLVSTPSCQGFVKIDQKHRFEPGSLEVLFLGQPVDELNGQPNYDCG